MNVPIAPDRNLILLLLVVVAWCGATDVRSRRIPNALTFPAMCAGLLCHSLAGGLPGLVFSLAGLGLGFGLILVFHMLGQMGAGDVKLMAAVGSVLGPAGVFTAFLFTTVFGGLWALGRVASRHGGLAGGCRKLVGACRGLLAGQLLPADGGVGVGGTSMPYGPAVAAGVLAALAWTWLGHDYFSVF